MQPGSAAEHDEIGERVAAQAVGAVQPGRHLAGREEAGHGGLGGVGVHAHAAHHVVAGRSDFHRLLGDVDVGQLLELVVHRRQPLADVVGGTPRIDVEEHTAVGAAAPGLDLAVDGARYLVTREQVGGAPVLLVGIPGVRFLLVVGRLALEELRDVIEHEPLALVVLQGAAVAAHALGDENPANGGRPHHPGRVELHELHVDEVGTRPQRGRLAVTGVLPRVRGDLPGLADAAGGQDDRLGLEEHELAGVAPVAHRARDAVAVLEQALDLALHVDVDALVNRVVLERADHLQPRAVAHVGQPRVAVAAEVALEDQAVLGAIEQRAPALQLQHAIGRLLGVQLGHAPVVDHLAAAHGVAEVDLPVVLRPHVAHGGRDAALGHHGVSLAEERLADEANGDALRGGLDGGPQAGTAGPDDDDVVLVGLVL